LPPLDSIEEATSALRFEWMNWPQARQPFSDSEKEFIQNLNVDADYKLLKVFWIVPLHYSQILTESWN
jgi:hypothetical protein